MDVETMFCRLEIVPGTGTEYLIDSGSFVFFVPHQARAFAEKRYRDVTAAFYAQTTYQEGDDRYDVNKIIKRLLTGSSSE